MDNKTKEPVKDPNPYLEPNRAKEPKKEQGFENKFANEEKKLTEPEKQIELFRKRFYKTRVDCIFSNSLKSL